MKTTLLTPTLSVLAIAALVLSFTELGGPDLYPDRSPQASGASQFGNSVSCRTKAILISNTAPTAVFKVGFYLSTDTTISITDKLISTYTVYASGSNTTVDCKAEGIDLSNLAVANGTYYIGTFLDIDNDVKENMTMSMNNEVPNNNWAFRDAAGKFTVVTYPALDVSLPAHWIRESVQKKKNSDGSLNITLSTSNEMSLSLKNAEGKVVYQTKGKEFMVPAQPAGLYFLTYTDGHRQAIEKVLW